MTDYQRIKKVLNWYKFLGIGETDTQLAEMMGYRKASLSQVLNGKEALNEKFVNRLCQFDENINKIWVLTGEGEMFLNDSKNIPNGLPTIEIQTEAWEVIKQQTASLAMKDSQINDLVALLNDTVFELKKNLARQEDNVITAVAG